MVPDVYIICLGHCHTSRFAWLSSQRRLKIKFPAVAFPGHSRDRQYTRSLLFSAWGPFVTLYGSAQNSLGLLLRPIRTNTEINRDGRVIVTMSDNALPEFYRPCGFNENLTACRAKGRPEKSDSIIEFDLQGCTYTLGASYRTPVCQTTPGSLRSVGEMSKYSQHIV